MMKICILDDDIYVVRILKKIINDCNLGTVVSYSTDGTEGYQNILQTEPELVLIDILMPGKDGLSIVKELKKTNSTIEFVMISQVASKDMVGKAYQYGVEYYIHKPINALEVENIILKVQERIKVNRTMEKIQSLFLDNQSNFSVEQQNNSAKEIKDILIKLGVMGEKGSKEIIDICNYVLEHNIDLMNVTLKELFKNFTDNPKSMEQRIRRTISVAMSNIANLGIEDFMNEIFIEYSSTLFHFEQVKKKMDYIRNKSSEDGSISVKKFLTGLTVFCENKDK
ncbi:response regulator [Natranaerobius trueperi]|nr:response regulator [Natranaerobius trueperi]